MSRTPDTELFDEVVGLWLRILDHPDLGADANFFGAGGTSIRALQMLAQVRDLFRIDVPLETFLAAPSARRFAALLLDLRREQGLADAALPLTSAIDAAVREAVGEARHFGVQLYVSLRGEPVCDLAAGEREGGEALDRDDLLPWFSGGKPLLATAVCRLWHQGAIDLDAPISTYLPELTQGGPFSCRHMLTHSTGRIYHGDPYAADPATVGYEQAVRAALTARLHPEDTPGAQPSYSPSASVCWLLLSELVRRLDGRRFDRYVLDEVAGPVGMEAYYGFSADQLATFGPRVTTYHRPRDARHNTDAHVAQATANAAVLSNGTFHAATDPGEGLWTSARSLGKFYEHLCARVVDGSWAGSAGPLDGPTARELAKAQRPTFFDEPPMVEFGLGVTRESRQHGADYMYFGSHTGEDTFGHQGHGWSPMAYADPACGLVVAFNGNGLPGRVAGKVIWTRISDAVYADVGAKFASRADEGVAGAWAK